MTYTIHGSPGSLHPEAINTTTTTADATVYMTQPTKPAPTVTLGWPPSTADTESRPNYALSASKELQMLTMPPGSTQNELGCDCRTCQNGIAEAQARANAAAKARAEAQAEAKIRAYAQHLRRLYNMHQNDKALGLAPPGPFLTPANGPRHIFAFNDPGNLEPPNIVQYIPNSPCSAEGSIWAPVNTMVVDDKWEKERNERGKGRAECHGMKDGNGNGVVPGDGEKLIISLHLPAQAPAGVLKKARASGERESV